MTVFGTLEALTEAARPALVHRRSRGFGPFPLTVAAAASEPVRMLTSPLLASIPACWSPLQVTLLSSDELHPDRLPEAIRPRGQEMVVARRDQLTALSSGPEQSFWLFQPEQASAVFWSADLDALPLWERSSPLRSAAHWWATRNGGAMVHAGAVGDGRRCVLLVGAGGAGKSTSSLACLRSGLQVLGDDYCLLQPPPTADATPVVHAMYRHAKLDTRSLDLLPDLQERVIGPAWRGKWLIDLGGDEISAAPLAAVCEVVQDPVGPTRIEPQSRMATLRAMAPTTMFQQRLWERETWQALTATVRHVSCFRLMVNDPLGIPDQVRLLLAGRTP